MTPITRLRAYGDSGLSADGSTRRIVGVDIARGLAVLGMFGAHVGVQQPFDWVDLATWTDVVNGRSSVLFAVLAGVSISIISGSRDSSGKMEPWADVPLVQARARILVRAALIFAIGGVLELLGTPVAVILPYYAVLFVMSLPFLQWSASRLLLFATAIAIVMPAVVYLPRQSETAVGFGPGQVLVDLLVTGYYPCLVWMAFLLAGMGLGRLDLGALHVQVRLLVAGVILATVGYGGAAIATRLVDPNSRWFGLFTSEPHGGSTFEVVGSTGFAVAVIALCLLATRIALRWLLLPIAAVGAMALSAYSVQIVGLAYIVHVADSASGFLGFEPDNGLWLAFTIVALVACTVWFVVLGRGPLERFLTWVSGRAARVQAADRVGPAAQKGE